MRVTKRVMAMLAIVGLCLMGLSTVASASNPVGSAKWCKNHPNSKLAACKTGGGGGTGGTPPPPPTITVTVTATGTETVTVSGSVTHITAFGADLALIGQSAGSFSTYTETAPLRSGGT
jgi:hypothetical protein